MDSVIIGTSHLSCHVTTGNGLPTRRTLNADGPYATHAISEICSVRFYITYIKYIYRQYDTQNIETRIIGRSRRGFQSADLFR